MCFKILAGMNVLVLRFKFILRLFGGLIIGDVVVLGIVFLGSF